MRGYEANLISTIVDHHISPDNRLRAMKPI